MGVAGLGWPLARAEGVDIFRRGEVLSEGQTNEEEVRLMAISARVGVHAHRH